MTEEKQQFNSGLEDIQKEALHLLKTYYVSEKNNYKYEHIEIMIKDKTSLKRIWTKWSHDRWSNILKNNVGGFVMYQLFHDNVNRYDEFFDENEGNQNDIVSTPIIQHGLQNQSQHKWVDVEMNSDINDFEYKNCLYRVMIKGGGEQWFYSTSVAAKSITIRICQGNQLGAIHHNKKNQWVAYQKGSWGNVANGPHKVFKMQKHYWN
eukprot:65109_1